MYVTQLIKQASWSTRVKLVLAYAVAVAVGLGAAWTAGDVLHITKAWGNLTAADILGFGTVVWGIATVWYHRYFGSASWDGVG
jgi:hypothetical protein